MYVLFYFILYVVIIVLGLNNALKPPFSPARKILNTELVKNC